uniref:28S rRNA (uridine-N(3))-methyltransferase n=1 Tax=Callorhinchus milii TaxID=7868 RepID=A0A4W3HEF8_CALMI
MNLLKKLEKQKLKEMKVQKDLEEAKEEKGRLYTVSVALPGSVLDNAQSPELRTYLAGQIARACTVFCVDEIVVFDEQGEDVKSVEGEFRGVGKKGHGSVQLARILQYLECPQYLRKSFFPKHHDLQFAGELPRDTRDLSRVCVAALPNCTLCWLAPGLLNPLDSPHHMRLDEAAEYREGVVVDRPSKPGKGSLVNCGMKKEVRIDRQLQAGLRVTVQLDGDQNPDSKVKKGTVVAPHLPRTRSGLYWGYTVRLASCLSAVFTECPFKEGYDLTIGTSERGSSIDQASLPSFRHMLMVFGGLQGLETSVDFDPNLQVADPQLLFHHYLDTCPGQGSRTIRTEEAILISLSALRPKIVSANGATSTSQDT